METTPTHIVIFGGTGDLSKRKLLGALLDLYIHNKLPESFTITGIAREEMTHEQYRNFVRTVLENHEHQHDTQEIISFCDHVQYLAGSFTSDSFYIALNNQLGEGSNRLLYLAVPPTLYEIMFEKLHEHNLTTPTSDQTYTRILVEKPFGNDLASAQALDQTLGNLFAEEQIFRIDHYLAKEAVQNILSFRFANAFFKDVWNKEHIASVHITMHETIDVGDRASFYEGVGTLRDVGQNHLLQLLALVAMDEPTQFTADSVRTARTEILHALRIESSETIANNVFRAQYNNYRDGKGVPSDSDTETYFATKTFIDTPNWRDVPFHISAGKGLNEALVSVVIKFHDVATGPFVTDACLTAGNQVELIISPEQSMHITLNAKAPGLGYQIESRTLSFDCMAGEAEIKNSYEKVLLDCLSGDQTLFTTTAEVLAAWQYVGSILDHWDQVPLTNYPKGTTPEVPFLDK